MPILESRADQSAIRKMVAAISAFLFPHSRTTSDRSSPARGEPANERRAEACPATIRQRLAEAEACLENLYAERGFIAKIGLAGHEDDLGGSSLPS